MECVEHDLAALGRERARLGDERHAALDVLAVLGHRQLAALAFTSPAIGRAEQRRHQRGHGHRDAGKRHPGQPGFERGQRREHIAGRERGQRDRAARP